MTCIARPTFKFESPMLMQHEGIKARQAEKEERMREGIAKKSAQLAAQTQAGASVGGKPLFEGRETPVLVGWYASQLKEHQVRFIFSLCWYRELVFS